MIPAHRARTKTPATNRMHEPVPLELVQIQPPPVMQEVCPTCGAVGRLHTYATRDPIRYVVCHKCGVKHAIDTRLKSIRVCGPNGKAQPEA